MWDLLDHSVEVGAEAGRIYSRGSRSSIGYGVPRDKLPREYRTQLGYWNAVAGHHKRPASLDLAQHRCGIIAEFALGNCLFPLHANAPIAIQHP